MKKTYFLIVLFLCGLSVGNVFAAAPAADHLGQELRAAAQEGNEPEVERLIARGADVNAADQYGWTALIWASETGHKKGHKNIVKMLLDEGADKDLKTRYGHQTAEAIARQNEYYCMHAKMNKIANMIRDYVPSPTRDEMETIFVSEREKALRAIEKDRAPDSLLGLLPREILLQEIAAQVLQSAKRNFREREVAEWLETHPEMTAEEENERRRRLDALANPGLEGGAGAGL